MDRQSALIVNEEVISNKTLSTTAELRNEQFCCVPLAILRMKFSAGALKGLLGLLSFRNQETGQCNPRVEKLCERLNAPDRTVRRWLRELRTVGILETTKHRSGLNTYIIQMPMAKSGRTAAAKNGRSGVAAPLVYEQIKGNKRARAEARTRSFPPKKSAQSETVARYYEAGRKKAGN
jgi:hypothetical protein